jgi:hypothetical protein
MGAAIVSPIAIEHDDRSSKRHLPHRVDLRMTFSDNRYPLFRITLWKRSILQRFSRQRKPLSAGE